ncbi:nephrin-like, partial [Penaeus monodon]|uniref:nephrin-like n=1 Tax=Penaeus monodon TaxID=6687 RepID=UPI0018A73994
MCPQFVLLMTWLLLAAAVEIKKIPVRGVTAIVGGVADLPCEVSHPPLDDIILLLWFKDGLTTPIYRYDSRRQGQAEHRSDTGALGSRVSLDVTLDPAVLRVASLTLKDEALYFCRVDFRMQPTKTTRVSLTVVVPPTGVSVFVGGSSQPVSSMVGPYQEGAVVELTCVAHGGKPRPAVVWYKDTLLLDDIMESEIAVDNATLIYSSTTATTLAQGPQTPENTSKEAATTLTPGPPTTTAAITTTLTTFSTRMTSESFNTLQLGPLTRHDLKLLLTCEASNYNRTLPTSTVVMVDMNLPPLSVTITSPPPFLRAGQEYEVTCEVMGARPPPTVTWWQGARQVLHAALETSEDGNLTSSHLTLTPRPEDDGKVLKCVAESYVTNTVMHDSWTITVHYRPTATARFGSSLDVANIKEGDDVYFECDVYANPEASRVSWRLDNQVLNHNVSAGVIVSNHALVLQRVVRAWAGLYSCHALNPVGDGVSNTLRLDVKYAPVCSPGQVTTYAVGRYEDAEVTCSVDANPALTKFQWTFNNTADIIDVPQGRFSSDSTVSVITYTPMTSLDYGTLLCWAYNSIGTQRVPCVFHIVPAGKPDPPSNCSVGGVGGSRTSVRVVCSSEGGAGTSFLLQARVVGGSHALNVSSPTPGFMVDGLRPGRKYDLFITAHNDKGASTPAHLTIAAHGSVYQHHDGPSEAEVRDGGKTAAGDEGAPGYPYLH